MRKTRYLLLLTAAAVLCAGVEAWAEETAPKPTPPENITVVVKVEPNEVRNYKVTVDMKGHAAPEPSAKPIDVQANYSMKMQQKFGRREGDGLLPLEITATDAQATVDGEKFALPATDFPKLTMLIDSAWKIDSTFGVVGTRYAGQSPGLNFANLIMLFFIPDMAKPHALGESWQSKVKLPGFPDECSVTTMFKSVDSKDGAKTVNVHQDYVWTGQKLENGAIADSKASVDSVLVLDTGTLLRSHADCQVVFRKSQSSQQDSTGEWANTKIDILRVK